MTKKKSQQITFSGHKRRDVEEPKHLKRVINGLEGEVARLRIELEFWKDKVWIKITGNGRGKKG